MRNFITILSALLFTASSLTANAQSFVPDSLGRRYQLYCQWLCPEKVYIHMDRTQYVAGETIWLRGFVKNASKKALLAESNYIYVELLNADSELMHRIKLKRDGQVFPGCINLKDNIPEGRYTLRAYTIWQMDNSPEYMFNQAISILGPKSKGKKKSAGEGVQTDGLDISFYPEGGRYFSDQGTRIAFKAMDKAGRSVEVQGRIVDSEGESITFARTTHDGMGFFFFYPKSGTSYSFEVNGKLFPLPAPATEGVSMILSSRKGNFVLRILGVENAHYTLLLRDISKVMQISEFQMAKGSSRNMILEKSILHKGINHLLLVDDSGKIASERLFYIYGEDEVVPSFRQFPGTGQQRAVVRGQLTLNDAEGKPLDGNCSVSVIRGSLARHSQDDGIYSYMHLSSELKGHINDPLYYFDKSIPENDRVASMDLLMMIQGWRYYKLDQIIPAEGKLPPITHLKEYMQSVTGKISRTFSDKMPKKFSMFVMIPKLKFNSIMNVAEGSSFIIDSLDFAEDTGFLIKISRQGGIMSYMPKWTPDIFADKYAYFPAPGKATEEEGEAIPLVYEAVTDTLQAAVVSAEVLDPYADHVNGHTTGAAQLKNYENWTLVSYLQSHTPSFTYKDEQMYNRRFDKTSFNQGVGGDESEEGGMDVSGESGSAGGEVKLVIDGSEQPWWIADNLYIGDIESLSVSTMPDLVLNSQGGLVSVRMKYGVTLEHNSDTEPSLIFFTPLGYQIPDKFYAPRYDRGDVNDEFDRRNTIWWNPSVNITAGKAQIRFCDTDQQDYPYLLRIEGLSSNGTPFSCHTLIKQGGSK